MPGTHYDNDYGLINELCINERDVANEIIKNSTLEDLYKAKNNEGPVLESYGFNEFSKLSKMRMLNAMIVCKLTCIKNSGVYSHKMKLFVVQEFIRCYAEQFRIQGKKCQSVIDEINLNYPSGGRWLASFQNHD